jgi:nitroimidazol reductase NimA-like FMN-containing flavoprotein (pyridoxamine 5'-phosphate oxidase superfamily)
MSLDPLRVHRLSERQRFDREALHDVLDAALVAHVAVVGPDGAPVVLPLLFGRDGDRLLLHGSTGGGLLRSAAAGAPIAVGVTVLDGLVYARSMFESSANYRSAMVRGRCRPVEGEAKLEALQLLSERLMPGRWEEVRSVTPKELAATLVLELPLDEASVKVRTGPPSEEEGEPAEDDWWGVVPVASAPGLPVPAPGVRPGAPLPPSVRRLTGN